jgi:hypothetical protein
MKVNSKIISVLQLGFWKGREMDLKTGHGTLILGQVDHNLGSAQNWSISYRIMKELV